LNNLNPAEFKQHHQSLHSLNAEDLPRNIAFEIPQAGHWSRHSLRLLFPWWKLSWSLEVQIAVDPGHMILLKLRW